ncbi:PREDICTED: general odorant-binding protein 99a [Eufriesea mexicana]|uniref:general odorant-binding protein 99a n=1 Tax=Eufriesea mexicana TaxID=516756 RepID=UPI00083BCD0E|nr:PREDICTED: general odorant-binding protein 99a [Eufriesea mexicana]
MRVMGIWLALMCFLALQLNLACGGMSDIDEFRKMTANYRKKCMAETKVKLEIIEDTEYGEFPDDDKLKCYFKCVLEKFKMMDKDGKIKYNLLKKVIPNAYKELGNEMIDSCSDVDDVDKCEKSFKFMKCMYEVNPIAFIAP